MEKLTITVEQAGELLGISRALAYEMARTGKLPVLRFGRRLVVPKKAMENMLGHSEKVVATTPESN
jgi:excisionase family DNA binding protein